MRAFFAILLAMFCVACSKADADKAGTREAWWGADGH